MYARDITDPAELASYALDVAAGHINGLFHADAPEDPWFLDELEVCLRKLADCAPRTAIETIAAVRNAASYPVHDTDACAFCPELPEPHRCCGAEFERGHEHDCCVCPAVHADYVSTVQAIVNTWPLVRLNDCLQTAAALAA